MGVEKNVAVEMRITAHRSADILSASFNDERDASSASITDGAIDTRTATVSLCKLEVWIFEQTIHEDNQFAHAGHQRHFGFLARRAQPQVAGFENTIMLHRAQRGHVDRASHRGPSAGTVPHTLRSAAVAVVGGH